METLIPGSFRDPSGFLFTRGGDIFRQVNLSYQADYDLLIKSGLYNLLVKKNLLIPHEETVEPGCTENAYKIIKPTKIASISYPYEWSFSQFKDAALLTLEIQRLAIGKNLSLKDASAYNVQFYDGRPVFIDTLSFEQLPEGQPWVAYKQFCQHFLAPLALMSKTDITLSQLLRSNIDGIPLSLASRLLPLSTKFNFSLLIHIHLHAKAQSNNADKGISKKEIKGTFTKTSFLALLDNLKSAINSLQWKPAGTEWHDYYESNNNYEMDSLSSKEKIVNDFVKKISPCIAWDLGANTGRFSRIAAQHCQQVCAWDIDPACVEINYRAVKENKETNILPLLQDLTNPSPSIGWAHEERMSLAGRGSVDLVLALGLIHHLAISNNLPLHKVAKFFRQLSGNLIIEFVPKSDSQVKKLLSSREDIFPFYSRDGFEAAFKSCFAIIEVEEIPDSDRIIYLMQAV